MTKRHPHTHTYTLYMATNKSWLVVHVSCPLSQEDDITTKSNAHARRLPTPRVILAILVIVASITPDLVTEWVVGFFFLPLCGSCSCSAASAGPGSGPGAATATGTELRLNYGNLFYPKERSNRAMTTTTTPLSPPGG